MATPTQKTVTRACRKVLKDTSVPDPVRRKRAQALVLLGAHFKATGKRAMAALAAEGQGGGDARRHVEETMLKVMAVQQGQEV